MHLIPTRLSWLWSPETKARILGSLLICSILSSALQPNLPAAQLVEKKPSPTESYTDTDGYRIYAVLLEGEKRSQFVIQAETDSWEEATPDNLDIKGDSKFMKLWGPTLRDFAVKDRTRKMLSKSIPLTAAYELVPQTAITSIFKYEQGWTTFWKRYPFAYGYYTFSAVGFDPQRTRAVVWMTYLCGGLCGYGRYHFFEKSHDVWREVSVKADVAGLNF